ncbi:unnamed protein product [Lampetra planeri]
MSQQASDGESEAVPTLQQPSRPPDIPLQLGCGLQDARSRLAELLLAATSILAEITQSGGGVADERGEIWRQAAALASTAPRLGNWRQTQAPATGTAMQVEFGAILPTSALSGGGQEHHVGEGLQSTPATSSLRDRRRRDQPVASAGGAAISLYGGAAREYREPGADQTFQQQLPVLMAFQAEGGDWGAFQRRFLAHQEMSGWTDAEPQRPVNSKALYRKRSSPRRVRGDWRSGGQSPQRMACKHKVVEVVMVVAI